MTDSSASIPTTRCRCAMLVFRLFSEPVCVSAGVLTVFSEAHHDRAAGRPPVRRRTHAVAHDVSPGGNHNVDGQSLLLSGSDPAVGLFSRLTRRGQGCGSRLVYLLELIQSG